MGLPFRCFGFVLSHDFGSRHSDVFGRNDLAFFICRSHEGAFGQKVGPSEEAAGALVDGQDGFIGKQLVFAAGDLQVMLDVSRHIFVFDAFEMASADDA